MGAPRAPRPSLAPPPLPRTLTAAPARPCCRIHLCQTGKGSQGARCGPHCTAAAVSLPPPPLLPPDALPLLPWARLKSPLFLYPPCRDFILSSYQELKKANPTFPILVRECSGVEAKLIARYGERGND